MKEACRGLGGPIATIQDATIDANAFLYRVAHRFPDVLASGAEIDGVQTEEIDNSHIPGK